MSTEGSLIPLETINGVEVFTGHKLDELLEAIRKETTTLVPDVSTVDGRKSIASVAYKIARSKTTIDDAGKSLVSGWKKQAAEVDAARKKARDYLDALKDEVRAPLNEYEAEQARIEQEAITKAQHEREEAEAAARAEMERKEAELVAREQAVAKAEAYAKAKAYADQAEKVRIEREDTIRKEAAAKAEQDAVNAAEQAKKDQATAVAAAELRVRQDAEAEEQSRLKAEAEAKVKADKAASNVAHQKKINNEAVDSLESMGVDRAVAINIVKAIATDKIKNVYINY